MSGKDGDQMFKTTKTTEDELRMCKEEAAATSPRHGGNMAMSVAERTLTKYCTTKLTEEELKMCASEAKGKIDHMMLKITEQEKCVPQPELKMSAEATVTVFGGKIDHVKQVGPGQLKMHMTATHEDKETSSCGAGAVVAPTEELKVGRPAAAAQGMLHQAQAEVLPALSKASRYPAVLAGVAAITGISTFMYYRTVNVHSAVNEDDDHAGGERS